MRATLADQAQHGTWDYRAVRPLSVPSSWHPGQRVGADCSFGVKDLCHWAGVKDDPTGDDWGGYGNSFTMTAHLPHVAHASDLEVGDIVTFDRDSTHGHAAMVLEPGSDPLLWSHGHQDAPNEVRVSFYNSIYTYRHYLKLRVPHQKPTKDDLLRARTGYWAWMQWVLGEGAWKHKGKANRKVRPNVRNPVPLKWWVYRARFLRARKRANQADKGDRG